MSTDDPEGALLEAVGRAPHDVQARTVYADWLEERGDPRGEFLRLEMQMTTLPERLAALVKRIDPAWLKMISGTYRVSLTETSPNKIALIKLVRECTGLGLRDAKDFVESASAETPRVLADEVEIDGARELVARFQPLVNLRVEPQIVVRTRDRQDLAPDGEYRRPYRILLVSIMSDRRLDVIRLLRERTGKGMTEVRDIVTGIQAGTPFEIASRIDASTAAELAVELGAYGTVKTELV